MLEGISKADIESLLRHRRWLEPVPGPLLAHHMAQRQREFARLVLVWWPAMLIAFAGFISFTWWGYHEAFTTPDLWVFWLTELLCFGLCMLGLRWGFQGRAQARFEQWVLTLFGLIVAARLGSSLLMHHEALAVNAVHMALLVCVVGSLGLHLGLRAATWGCALGCLALVVLPWAVRPQDALLVTGHEAAAHGGDVTSLVLIPAIRQITTLPIIATGGFGTGGGLLAALALVAGAFALWRRGGQRKQVLLMLVLAVVAVSAAAFVLVNLLVDLLYPILDPRITHAPKVT